MPKENPGFTPQELNKAQCYLKPLWEAVGCSHNPGWADNYKDNPVVGMELENEIKQSAIKGHFKDHGFCNLKDWKYHSENSLRYHGFEYVSVPTRYTIAEASLKGLYDSLFEYGASPSKFTNSIRTSFHVHFNQSHLPIYDTILFACAYYIFEPLLQDFCGAHRQNNLFCLRLQDTVSLNKALKQVITGDIPFQSSWICSSDNRYGSVNFNSMMKFGTLEFRMMRASSNADELFEWLTILHRIRRWSIECGTFDKLVEVVQKTPFEVLAKEVLGTYLLKTLENYLDSYPTVADALRAGYFNTLPTIRNGLNYNKDKCAAVLDVAAKYQAKQKEEAMKFYASSISSFTTNNVVTYSGEAF